MNIILINNRRVANNFSVLFSLNFPDFSCKNIHRLLRVTHELQPSKKKRADYSCIFRTTNSLWLWTVALHKKYLVRRLWEVLIRITNTIWLIFYRENNTTSNKTRFAKKCSKGSIPTSNKPRSIIEVPETSHYNWIALISAAWIRWNLLKETSAANAASKNHFNQPLFKLKLKQYKSAVVERKVNYPFLCTT